MHVIGSFGGHFSFSIERFVCKRSCLINHCLTRQFKTLYKLNNAKRMIEKFRNERELELYKSRILTVPNFLTVSRLTISPFFPWLLMNGHTEYAFGLLAYCASSDVVIVSLFPYINLIAFSLMAGLRDDLIKNQLWDLYLILSRIK